MERNDKRWEKKVGERVEKMKEGKNRGGGEEGEEKEEYNN